MKDDINIWTNTIRLTDRAMNGEAFFLNCGTNCIYKHQHDRYCEKIINCPLMKKVCEKLCYYEEKELND